MCERKGNKFCKERKREVEKERKREVLREIYKKRVCVCKHLDMFIYCIINR